MSIERQSHQPHRWRALKALAIMAKLCLVAFVVCAYLLAERPAAEATVSSADSNFSLQSVQREIEVDYADVRHISTSNLEITLAARGDIVLLDVRDEKEFAVSRLDGALRVDPDIWQEAFIETYAGALKGKIVVFYCSVGVRSSALAEQVQDALLETGADAVFNLEGGIFEWHNEHRRLVSAKGETDYIPPYDDYWAQLLTRQDQIRYDRL